MGKFKNVLGLFERDPDLTNSDHSEFPGYRFIRLKAENKLNKPKKSNKSKKPQQQQDDIFAFHLEKDLRGQGSFGAVFKAHRINPLTGQLDLKNPVAVKVVKTEQFKEKELEYFNRYNQGEGIVSDLEESFIIMEYLPGEDVVGEEDTLSSSIKNLSLLDKANVLVQLASLMNSLHHYTPSTEEAMAHGDIKGQNFRAVIPKKSIFKRGIKSKAPIIRILDLATALEMPNKEPNEATKVDFRFGTYVSMAPEMIESLITLKSDIYSLLPLFLLILGVEKPFSQKDPILNQLINNEISYYEFFSKLKETTLNFDQLFENLNIPEQPVDIKPLILKFLKRMGDKDPTRRPDSDELLRFTMAFYQFCLIHDQTKKFSEAEKLEKLQEQVAKISLLAEGKWYNTIGIKEIEIIPKIDEIAKKDNKPQLASLKITTKTFEQHEFFLSPNFNELLVIAQTHEVDLSLVQNFCQYDDKFLRSLLEDIKRGPENKTSIHQKITDFSRRYPLESEVPQEISTQHKELQNKAIARMREANLLTNNFLNKVYNNIDLCRKIVEGPSRRIAYLALADDNEAGSYLEKLQIDQKIKIHQWTISKENKIIAFFGTEGYKTLIQRTLLSIKEDVSRYKKQFKPSIFNNIASFWRSHSIQKKIKAMEFLEKCLEQNNFVDYFKPENSSLRDAIAKNNLPSNLKSNQNVDKNGIILYAEQKQSTAPQSR